MYQNQLKIDSPQTFNEYSYCLNNPLKYSDPSGMLAKAYDESDAALDAYFGWMTDVTGTWHMSGSGGWGGYAIGADQNYVGTFLYESNVKFYGYTHNRKDGLYRNRYTSQIVSYDEVYNNYIVANSSLTVEFHPPISPSENSQSNDQNDPCGIDSWEFFYNLEDAESYLKENENCKKEKFMYITDDQWVLVGPWNDATIKHVSPRRVDRYSKGSIYEDGCIYKVDFFVHTHFRSSEPSSEDKQNGTYYYYPYGVRTLIYFERQYYEFDLKTWGKKYFFKH